MVAMKTQNINSITIVLLFILLFSVTNATYSQDRGSITGRISDQQTGEYLPGANVILEGTNYGAATSREGEFRIFNVPSGIYALTVRYMGYETYTSTVEITPQNRRVQIEVNLTPSYVELGEIVVEGLRQGQVKALSMERESSSIKNVVSREQMDWFPDINVAEALQRVPGVHIDRSLGDGRYALIRGTEPRLSNVTVNGMSLATNRNEQRTPQLDIVGTGQLAFLEVIKAITPDMDANTIGGTINIITRSAFDYPARHLGLGLGGGYSNLGGEPNWQGNINYSDKFGAKNNWGVSINVNWDDKTRGTDRIEPQWGEERNVLGNIIPFALQDLNLRDYTNRKYKLGLGSSLEFRPNPDNRLYVNIMWNKYWDDQNRARWRIRPSNGNYLDAEGLLVSGGRLEFESDHRLEENIQTHYSFGGEHFISNVKLDYMIGYSYGEQFENPNMRQIYRHDNNLDMALDFSDPDYPNFSILHDNEMIHFDPGLYRFRGIDYAERFTSNDHSVGEVNVESPYHFLKYPATVKVGTKLHMISKDRKDDRWDYSWSGARIYMDQFLLDRERNDFMSDNYVYGPQPDNKKMLEHFRSNRDQVGGFIGDLNYSDSRGGTYNASENVFAYYAMTDVVFGSFSILAGVRHEFTYNDYEGTLLIYDSAGDFSSDQLVREKRDYNNFLPMIHFRVDLTQMTNIRLAFTQTLSRPDYWHLAPYFELDHRRERIRQGNPDLKPTTASNVDLMASHYFQGIGIASVGVFYKSLSDIIYNRTEIISEGPYAGYLSDRNPINGGSATLIGFELNWQQEFTFLPGYLSGIGILANYTYTNAEADLIDRKGFLPGQAGDVANFAFSYQWSGFEAVLSYAYQGKFLTGVGITEDHDYIVDSRGQLDFTVKQRLFAGLSMYGELVNITNEPARQYIGVRERPVESALYSWWSRVGIRYVL
jgi:TonB-dependent receptor